jgi:hypothetical protein
LSRPRSVPNYALVKPLAPKFAHCRSMRTVSQTVYNQTEASNDAKLRDKRE